MPYEHACIAAADVQPGDQLYSANKGDAPCYWWHRVKAVTDFDPYHVKIETASWYTIKRKGEGVSVRRWKPDEPTAETYDRQTYSIYDTRLKPKP